MTKKIIVLCALLSIVLSIAFLDRPLSLWAFENFHPVRKNFDALTKLVEAIEILVMAGLTWGAFIVASGRKLGLRDAAALRISLAVLTAIGVKDLLKIVFGRTWPETWTNNNPSFITDHVFIFSPFHGGQGFAAFPSGHETVTAAFCGALWILAPRLRWLCPPMLALVAVGLIGADYHWLSDVLAGGLLGWLLGVFVAKLELPKARAFSSEVDAGSR